MRDLTAPPAPADRGPDPRRAARLLQRHRRPGRRGWRPRRASCPQAEAVRAIDLLADAIAAVKEGSDPRTQLEVALLKAARPRADASIEALLMRLERLEQGAPDRRRRRRPRGRAARRPSRRPEPAPEAARPARTTRRRPPRASGRRSSSRRLWPAVLERVRDAEGGEMLAALLAEARPASLEDDELVLVVSRSPPRSASARSRTARTASASREALRAGRRAARSARASSYATARRARTTPARRPVRLTEDEVIERFKSEFDAEDVRTSRRPSEN